METNMKTSMRSPESPPVPTICYEIKPPHEEMPREIKCPHCRATLKAQDVHKSQAGEEFSENMFIAFVLAQLFHCVACGWWAVLEQRSGDYELYYVGEEEFMLMAVSRTGQQVALKQDEPPPWEWALNHKTCWAHPASMPVSKYVQLFGAAPAVDRDWAPKWGEIPPDMKSLARKLLLGALGFVLLVSFLAYTIH